MMRRAFVILSLLFLLLPAPGYGENEFLIGLIPEENIFRQIQRHRPLAAYLSEKLGVTVKFTILSRYGDIVDRFTSRDMEGAFFGIFTAALAQEKLGVVPVARPMQMDGSTTARGYMLVRKDSGIMSFAGTRGKRAVFVDRATATGYIFALALLRENGFEGPSKYFSEHFFTGSHDSAVYAVLDGKADVGFAKSRILNKLSAKDPLIKDEIRIVAKSVDLPDTTLCIRRDIPDDFKKRLTDVLISMDKDAKGREVLKALGAQKFVEAKKGEFEAVMGLAGRAGIDLKNYGYSE